MPIIKNERVRSPMNKSKSPNHQNRKQFELRNIEAERPASQLFKADLDTSININRWQTTNSTKQTLKEKPTTQTL